MHKNLGHDPDELRILGLITDEMYYTLKMREAAANNDVEEQMRLMHLQRLEKRVKKQKEVEERRRQEQEKKEQEKAIEKAIEKELPEIISKEFEKIKFK